MPATPKVLMLAMDAATPSLLRQWTDDGTLPNLARFRRDALVLDVAGPLGLEVASTWPTFISGQGPGEHGVSWIDWVIPGTYREQRMRGDDFAHVTPFWKALSDAGKRVAVFDVPFAPLAKQINGMQITAWGAHEGVFGFSTTPRTLKRRIQQTWGEYPVPLACETTRISADEYRRMADTLIGGITTRGTMTRELLADRSWDFAVQVFTELHCAGHLLWHYHDPSYPGADPAGIARYGDLLREVYVATDAAIGTILAGTGPETTVLIGSLHGMEHTCGTSLLLPHMLEGIGALRRASTATAAETRRTPARQRELRGLMRKVYRLVPPRARVAFYETRQRINQHWLRRGAPIDIEPSETRAFQLGFGAGSSFSGIRLNIRGREPEGVLEPGTHVDRYCDELRQGLCAFTDPESGERLVRRVLRTADLYPGPRTDQLPDLLVEWQYDPARGTTAVGSGAGGVWRGFSEKTGTIEHSNGSGRTGSHRLQGLLFVRGPGIQAGEVERVIPTVDFAPTIMRILGHEYAAGSGQLIGELLPRRP
ncbi:MAG: alkaline phosphatase family protein [Gemmatimonadales bacterium]